MYESDFSQTRTVQCTNRKHKKDSTWLNKLKLNSAGHEQMKAFVMFEFHSQSGLLP